MSDKIIDVNDWTDARPGFRITGLTIFTQIGDDDEEGLLAFIDAGQTLGGGMPVWMPMCAADQRRVDQLRHVAETKFAGVPWVERRFYPGEVLNEVSAMCDELAETLAATAFDFPAVEPLLARYRALKEKHTDVPT